MGDAFMNDERVDFNMYKDIYDSVRESIPIEKWTQQFVKEYNGLQNVKTSPKIKK